MHSFFVATAADGSFHLFQPIDVVELVKAIFSGLAALFGAIAAGYAVVGANRARRAEVKATALTATVEKIEQNTNSLAERAEEAARVAGVQEGVAKTVAVAEVLAEQHGKMPIEKALPGAAAKMIAEMPSPPKPEEKKKE